MPSLRRRQGEGEVSSGGGPFEGGSGRRGNPVERGAGEGVIRG